MGDHVASSSPAGADQLDQPGNRLGRVRGADNSCPTIDFSDRNSIAAARPRPRPGPGRPRSRCRPGAGRPRRCESSIGVAHHLERVVDAAVGDFPDCRGRVCRRSRRRSSVAPRCAGRGRASRSPVDGDDRRGFRPAGRRRSPAARLRRSPMTQHGARRCVRGRRSDGAEAGDHAAARAERLPEGDLVAGSGSPPPRRRPRSVGKAGDAEAVLEHAAILGVQARAAASSMPATERSPAGSHSVRRPARHALTDSARRGPCRAQRGRRQTNR